MPSDPINTEMNFRVKNTRYGDNIKNVCPALGKNEFMNRMKKGTTFKKFPN